jgi:hypothetical protein
VRGPRGGARAGGHAPTHALAPLEPNAIESPPRVNGPAPLPVGGVSDTSLAYDRDVIRDVFSNAADLSAQRSSAKCRVVHVHTDPIVCLGLRRYQVPSHGCLNEL